MILQKKKIPANVSFVDKDVYTNKLWSKETAITLVDDTQSELVIDYSHYGNWSKNKQVEPEYSDFLKLVNLIDEAARITITDGTLIKNLESYPEVKSIIIKLPDGKEKQYAVQNIDNVHSNIVTYEF